jgi:hypothetical protein
MNKLRLGPLPKIEPVKVSVALSTKLKLELDQYAALHSETYGETVDATALIPYILEAFISKDRVFQKTRKRR